MWAVLLLLPQSVGSLSVGSAEIQDALAAELIRVAREAVVSQVSHEKTSPLPDLGPSKPVFVTIERENRVIGCRGTLVSRYPALAAEIDSAARSAASHDPRYRPLTVKDLDRFLVTVTLVDRVETISNVDGLTPADGLILETGGKTGVVLPWEGKDPATRLRWAYQKAGVAPGSGGKLQRLIAQRWRG